MPCLARLVVCKFHMVPNCSNCDWMPSLHISFSKIFQVKSLVVNPKFGILLNNAGLTICRGVMV